MSHHTLLLGAHMSIAKGLDNAILAGESIGCTAIQIFTHSNRQWAIPKISDAAAKEFIATAQKSTIRSIVIHASYLLNIGSPNAATRKRSIQALIQELERCQQLEIPYLIVHPGARLTSTEDECIAHIADALDEVFEYVSGSSMILLENMAGQGSVIGATFEQLAEIYKKVRHKKRIGYCFDTCHALAAGYDFSTPEKYTALWKQFDAILGLEKLRAFHFNDSKKPLGSHVDRHEHIGQGQLGLEPFRLILNDPRFFNIPKILETPKDETLSDDIRNMATLKKLLSPTTKTKFKNPH